MRSSERADASGACAAHRAARRQGQPVPAPAGRVAELPPSWRTASASGELDVAAGTAWLWAREQFAGSVDDAVRRRGRPDVAGQRARASRRAAGTSCCSATRSSSRSRARPPTRRARAPPRSSTCSASMRPCPTTPGCCSTGRGGCTRELCRYTSEVFYDGKLTAVPAWNARDPRRGRCSGAGLRVVEVPHEGNTNASPEEAAEVADLVARAARLPVARQGRRQQPIGPADVLVVTPYNAQIRAIRRGARGAGVPDGVRVGTVDKFQGREAAVAIYSMATSSADDAPRGMEFLYDPHRLNVATSRAKALAIIVASPGCSGILPDAPADAAGERAMPRMGVGGSLGWDPSRGLPVLESDDDGCSERARTGKGATGKIVAERH